MCINEWIFRSEINKICFYIWEMYINKWFCKPQLWAPLVGPYFSRIQSLLQHLLNVGIGKIKWCLEWILQPQTQCCKSVATEYYGSGAEGNTEKVLRFPFSGLQHHFFDLRQHFIRVVDVHLWCSGGLWNIQTATAPQKLKTTFCGVVRFGRFFDHPYIAVWNWCLICIIKVKFGIDMC